MTIGIGAMNGGGVGDVGRGVACIGANAGLVRTEADADVLLELEEGLEVAEEVARGATAAGLALNLLRTSSIGNKRRR